MATTTAGVLEDTLATTSFMLPGMSSPEQVSYTRMVRFDNECVLIPKTSPTRSKMPVVLTKSYSLPLWKKRSNHLSDEDVEDAAGSSSQPQSPEDNRVTIKVPIPTSVFLQHFCVLFYFKKTTFQVQSKVLTIPSKSQVHFFISNYKKITTFMPRSPFTISIGFKFPQTLVARPPTFVAHLPPPSGWIDSSSSWMLRRLRTDHWGVP